MRQPQTGDAVAQDRRVRTMFLTYEADDAAAEVFAVVVGAVADNFRGVEVMEMSDDGLFAEGEDPRAIMHELVTAADRLTPDQRRQLAEFGETLAAWDGEEGT